MYLNLTTLFCYLKGDPYLVYAHKNSGIFDTLPPKPSFFYHIFSSLSFLPTLLSLVSLSSLSLLLPFLCLNF